MAERMNRTLFEKVRCLLLSARLPDEFWGLALQAACDVRNMCPVSGQRSTPFELFHGRKPDLSMLRVFGCDCFVHIPSVKRRDPKLGARSTPGMFVGYSTCSKAWRVATVVNGRITINDSRDVIFVENSFKHVKHDSTCDPHLGYVNAGVEDCCPPGHNPDNNHQSPDHGPDADNDAPDAPSDAGQTPPQVQASPAPPVAPPVRTSNRSNRGVPAQKFGFVVQGNLTDEPRTLKEVQFRPDFALWQQSMDEEMNSLLSMGVYEIVPTPPHARALDCRWVFKIKRDVLGNIEKYKSRVVVKGYQQAPGVDYEEIFAPVSRHTTVRVLLAMAAVHNLEVQQLDVKTAFLNGELKEETYMKLPPGYESPGQVCLLKRALYGLKQAARAWYLQLKGSLINLGYTVSNADPSLYLRGLGNDPIFLLIYVDDMLLIGNLSTVKAAKTELMDIYPCRDLGDASYFLGFEIVRDRSAKTLWIGQTKLVNDTLHRHQFEEANATILPMDAGLKLQRYRDGDEIATDQPYREIVGSLLYIANCTRPDIAFPVGVLSRFVSQPTTAHWAAAKRVLRYLCGTTQLGLKYGPHTSSAVGFSDSDLAGDPDRRRSTSGSIFLLHGAAILWTSGLQRTVAASTCEAEYIAASAATKNALWIRKLMADLSGSSTSVAISLPIRGDNTAALALLNEPGSGSRSTAKYIDLAYHFARDRVERGEVTFTYIKTSDMLADALTKALPKPAFQASCQSWGLYDRAASNPSGGVL
jgi:Reverse transcriptase (RNA-dependent DNA polymerase)